MLNQKNTSTYKAELAGIKAPLGVILYLIRRDNIDIYDIPIAQITKDYLGYLEVMEELEIDLAGEFFVMAATLMRIKAHMLLRREDDEEDPREELVRNLLEYKRIMEAAKSLKEREETRTNVFLRAVPAKDKSYREDPELDLTLYEVMRAFRQITLEFEAQDVRSIELEEFTLEEKINFVETQLTVKSQVTFKDLFAGSRSRLEIVVTFMAILELLKRQRIRVQQQNSFGEIWIYRQHGEQPDVPVRLPGSESEK